MSLPPIERVKGPYIKGCAMALGVHKTGGARKVNYFGQEKSIETIV
jgi:hypothetical protein